MGWEGFISGFGASSYDAGVESGFERLPNKPGLGAGVVVLPKMLPVGLGPPNAIG
mgnify:CR=1 FL=1